MRPEYPPRARKTQTKRCVPSSIQTVLSVPESHRFSQRLADFTAGGDLHPALKILFSSPTEYHGKEALSRKAFCGRVNCSLSCWRGSALRLLPGEAVTTIGSSEPIAVTDEGYPAPNIQGNAPLSLLPGYPSSVGPSGCHLPPGKGLCTTNCKLKPTALLWYRGMFLLAYFRRQWAS